jgi:hypothetical protein
VSEGDRFPASDAWPLVLPRAKHQRIFKPMSKSYNFPIYHKLFQFIKLLYKAVHSMPKEYKFSLGQELISLAWSCLELSIKINEMPNSNKKDELPDLSDEFDRLKLRIRMAQEVSIISYGQFTHWQTMYIDPIGCMIGGWLVWAEKTPLNA